MTIKPEAGTAKFPCNIPKQNKSKGEYENVSQRENHKSEQ